MTDTPSSVFSLTDRAIVVYFVLKECGMLTVRELCVKLNKSPASIYRALSELREAGIIRSTHEKPIQLPEPAFLLIDQTQFNETAA